VTKVAPRYWFPAKRYGWGWGPPTTWQGWVVLLAWLATTIPSSLWLASRHILLVGPFVLLMVIVLIVICYATGEPPRWRGGNDEAGKHTKP
jgi:hypothetical protein